MAGDGRVAGDAKDVAGSVLAFDGRVVLRWPPAGGPHQRLVPHRRPMEILLGALLIRDDPLVKMGIPPPAAG
jgi:hypothetical protein